MGYIMARNMMIIDEHTHSYELRVSQKWRIHSIRWHGMGFQILKQTYVGCSRYTLAIGPFDMTY